MSTFIAILKAIAQWCRDRNGDVSRPEPDKVNGRVRPVARAGEDLSRRVSECLKFVLLWEGGYVNHPNDPGGVTNMGVIQSTYDDYRRENGVKTRSVRHITMKEVVSIYTRGYYKAAGCDRLPAPLDLVVFDAAVNCGVARTTRWLQGAVGALEDGKFGPQTLACVELYPAVDTAAEVCDAREGHYDRLARSDRFKVFYRGWMNRLNALRKTIGLPQRPL